jgi:hypothetical protein
MLGGRRMLVRCLEINLEQKTAVVQMGGQRQTLRMKPD